MRRILSEGAVEEMEVENEEVEIEEVEVVGGGVHVELVSAEQILRR